jgi:hypothetical protein
MYFYDSPCKVRKKGGNGKRGRVEVAFPSDAVWTQSRICPFGGLSEQTAFFWALTQFNTESSYGPPLGFLLDIVTAALQGPGPPPAQNGTWV